MGSSGEICGSKAQVVQDAIGSFERERFEDVCGDAGGHVRKVRRGQMHGVWDGCRGGVLKGVRNL